MSKHLDTTASLVGEIVGGVVQIHINMAWKKKLQRNMTWEQSLVSKLVV